MIRIDRILAFLTLVIPFVSHAAEESRSGNVGEVRTNHEIVSLEIHSLVKSLVEKGALSLGSSSTWVPKDPDLVLVLKSLDLYKKEFKRPVIVVEGDEVTVNDETVLDDAIAMTDNTMTSI